MLQLPAATVALQLWVPSLIVTLPVGVPLPGAFAVTVNVKFTAWPTADGFGACAVIALVVPAAFTVWGAPADEVLPVGSALRGELALMSVAAAAFEVRRDG